MPIIGRAAEVRLLQRVLSSQQPEFLSLCGRRRIGKTFLIKQFFSEKKCLFLSVTGEKGAPMKQQIQHVTRAIGQVFYPGAKLAVGKNWDDTFALLTEAFNTASKRQKIVLFFDEFPWMATHNARLLQNLDYYWNQYWSNDPRIKLIICGSAASWIIDHIVNNKGGLHNRLTRTLFLEPLTLAQTKEFLQTYGVRLTHQQLVDLYLCMGGIPYYLTKVDKGLSATQVIEALAFRKKGFLLEEFDNLFASLFKESDTIVELIKIIASHRYGIGKNKLFTKMGTRLAGKGGMEKLKALEDAHFIMSFKPLFHKEKGIYYKVVDQYTLFYLYWVLPVKDTLLKKSLLQGYWDKMKSQARWNAWVGLSFESVCYAHLPHVTYALNLSPTAVPSTWRYVPRQGSEEQGAQIDLLFDRDDDAITLCEIKYTDKPFVVTKTYAQQIAQKIAIFKKVTRTRKQCFMALISASGVKQNKYTEGAEALFSHVITLDALFKEVQ